MLKISIRATVKCRKHPNFNPMHGEAAIKGGCYTCREIMDLWILARAASKSLGERIETLSLDPRVETEWHE
jgi:hypothetical protein